MVTAEWPGHTGTNHAGAALTSPDHSELVHGQRVDETD